MILCARCRKGIDVVYNDLCYACYKSATGLKQVLKKNSNYARKKIEV
jgi:hypothetical protein